MTPGTADDDVVPATDERGAKTLREAAMSDGLDPLRLELGALSCRTVVLSDANAARLRGLLACCHRHLHTDPLRRHGTGLGALAASPEAHQAVSGECAPQPSNVVSLQIHMRAQSVSECYIVLQVTGQAASPEAQLMQTWMQPACRLLNPLPR